MRRPTPSPARPILASPDQTLDLLEGKKFLIERWTIDLPAAPDGIAMIGAGEEPQSFRQHYFDSRGVYRVYEMSLAEGVWKLWRDSPNPFPQRYAGTFSDDGKVITGRCEKAEDGTNWEIDFELTHERVG